MPTISLHGIRLHALVGLYPEEKIKGNDFIVDIDISLPDALPWHYADYTLIREAVAEIFTHSEDLIETIVLKLYNSLKVQIPVAEKIKVSVKKLHPPMPGEVDYAMVTYEA